MPSDEIVRRVEQGGIGLVGLSASMASSDPYSLAKQVQRIAPVCRRAGAHLVLGGSGAWTSEPDEGGTTHRIQRFSELNALLIAGLD